MQDWAYLGWHRRDWMKPHVGKEASGAGFHADLLIFWEGHPAANAKQEILNHLPLLLPQKTPFWVFFPSHEGEHSGEVPSQNHGTLPPPHARPMGVRKCSRGDEVRLCEHCTHISAEAV